MVSNRHYPASKAQAGFSMVEVMVGMVISLVVTLVIFQVFFTTTSTARTTSAGNEAQISGNIAMFALERDLKDAGMGFGTNANLGAGCSVTALLGGANTTFPLVPVVITAGTSGAPDQLDVLAGNSAYVVAARRFSAGTSLSKTMVARGGLQLGDLAVVTDDASPATVCELIEISALSADGVSIEHNPGATYTSFYTGSSTLATHNGSGTAPAMDTGGQLYDLGPLPRLSHWSISADGSLAMSNRFGTGVAEPVGEGIVHLQAQYGVDDGAGGAATAGDGIISPAEWTKTAPTNWSQVLAVRFALLARSQQLEKTAVSGTQTWVGGTFTMSGLGADWPNYRYRVYEGVVAMRNMIWGTTP